MADFEVPGYEIYERLGRGGMATVYRAVESESGDTVAIKLIRAGGKPSKKQRDSEPNV